VFVGFLFTFVKYIVSKKFEVAYYNMPFPSNLQYTAVSVGGQPYFDVVGDESPAYTDLVGNAQFPSFYVAYDSINVYFRLRLNSDPRNNALTAFRNTAWGVLINTSGVAGTYDWLLGVDGLAQRVCLIQNTVKLFNSWNDPAEGTNGQGAPNFVQPIVNFDYARVTPADSSFGGNPDFFLDFFIPADTLFSYLNINPASPLQLISFTSTNANNYNKDSLRTSEGFQFQNALSNPVTPNDANVQAKLDVSKQLISGPTTILAGETATYVARITLSNPGRSTATTVFVRDIISLDVISNLTITNVESGSAIFDSSTKTISWNIGNLPAGSQTTLTFSVNGTFTSAGSRLLETATTSGIDNFTGRTLPVDTATTVITVQTTGGIVGNVKDQSTGVALQGVSVTLEQGPSVIATTTTNGNGDYSFSGLNPGSYTLTFSYPNYTTAVRGTQVLSGAISRVELLLTPQPASLSGTVTGSETGPLQGAIVRLTNSTGVAVAVTSTDVNGQYTILAIPPGSYTIGVAADNYQSVTRGIELLPNEAETDDFVLLQNPATIQGRVTDFLSNPISGALVEFVNETGIIITSTTTDAAGNYILNRLSAGTYRVRFSSVNYATLLLGTTLAPGETVTLDASLIPDPGSLSGTVRDAGNGAPLSDASIRVLNSSGITIAQTISNELGEYFVNQLPPGTFSVTYSVNGYGTIILGANIQSNTTTVVDAQLERRVGNVKGVITADTGTPIEGALIELYQNNVLIGSALTDSSGSYTINNLIPGTYSQIASAPNFSNSSTGVIIQDNETTFVDILLVPDPGILTGNVTSNGIALPGAAISVRDSSSSVVVSRTVTDDQGNYTVTNLSPGSYTVIASSNNFQTMAMGALISANQTTIVSFDLAPNPASITGVISNSSSGSPITGASVEVRIQSLNGVTVASTFTDPSGVYVVPNLAPGTYAVIVSANNFQTNTATVSLTAGESETLDIALTPSPGTIAGLITGSGGLISGATVRVTDLNGLTIQSVLTDATGNYSVGGLAPGSYTVVVLAPGFQTSLTGAIVQPDLITIRDVDLLPNPGSISGQISPILGGSVVQLYSADNILIASTTSTPQGTLQFDSLAPGQYILTAALTGYQTAVTGVTVLRDEVSNVSLTLLPNPSSVTGRIVSTSASPITNAVVQILDSNETIVGIGTTDSNGNYSIGNLPTGTFQVSVYAPNYSSLISGITTSPGSVITGADYQLVPNPGAIAGQVTDQNGNPLNGVTIIVRTTNGAFIGSVVTSPAGNYIVNNLAPGSYTVTANIDSYSTETVGAIFTSDQTTGANIRLSSIIGDVFGQVVDQQGIPVTGNNIQVRLLLSSGQLVRAFLANPDGTFTIIGLSPGRYLLNVTADSYSATTVPVDVVAGVTVPVTITLAQLPSVVTGQVVNEVTGEPISGAVIQATTGTGIFINRAISGSNGEFSVTNIPSGNVVISTSADNFGSNAVMFFLNPSETRNVLLRLSPQPGSLTGFVTNVADGEPISGTIVIVSTDTGGVITTAVSDQFGQFLIPDLNPGSYRATATADGFTTDVASFTILPLQTSVLSFALSPTPGVIKGVVRDRGTNQPLQGVSVIARLLSSSGPIIATTLTNGSGEYVFSSLSPNSYTLVASRSGYGSDSASTVVVANQTSLVDILLMSDPAIVTGNVTDELTGETLSNVVLRLFTSTGVLLASVMTDTNGDYTFNGLMPGRYRLIAVDPRYQREELSFDAVSNEVSTIDFSLNRIFGNLRGQITDAETGGALVGSLVIVFRSTDTDPIARALTDAEGNYFVPSLPPDTYNVVATAINYARNARGATILADATTVTNIALIPDPATISGTVQSQGGIPIPDATIKIISLNGVVAGTVSTDAAGLYQVSNLAAGTYTLVASAPGYSNSNAGSILAPGEVKDNVNFTLLQNAGSIIGVVSEGETGTPIAGAVISVRNSIGTIISTTTTDVNGSYIIRGIAPNSYTVSADKFGFSTNVVGAVVRSDVTTNADISLSRISGNISGTVVDAQGNPITAQEVSIKLTDTSGVILNAVIADNSGQFMFMDIRPGSYLLNVTTPGYQARTVSILVEANETTNTVIQLSTSFGFLRGTVVEMSTGIPLNGARIVVTDITNNLVTTGISDVNGTFFITNLPLGSLNVTASKSNYASTTKGVIINEGQTTETRLELMSDPGSLTGVVTNRVTGEEIVGASIRVIDSTLATITTVLSGDNGEFSVPGLAPGRYQINVTAQNFNTILTGVDILPDITTNENIALEPFPGRLTGTVTDLQTGVPIANTSIEVRAFGVSGPVVAVTITDNNGRYIVTNLTPGVYTIVANAVGYGTAEASEEVRSNTESVQDLVLSSLISSVRGRVTDQTGRPLSDTLISLAKDGAAIVVEVQTDINGSYEINNIDSGSYTITALNIEYQQSLQAFTVLQGEMRTVDFVLNDNPGSISGSVTDRDTGLAIPNAVIFVYNTENEPITNDVSDEFGRYSLLGLASGSYSLRVTASRYASDARIITVVGGQGTTADFELQRDPVTIRGSVTVSTNLSLSVVDSLDAQSTREGSGERLVMLQQIPIIDAIVTVFDENGLLVGRGATGPNGNYVIGNLPAGILSIVAETEEFQSETQTITALPGDDLTVNFVFARPTGSLTGFVINAFTRSPVSGANVILQNERSTFSTMTGTDGSFSFLDLAPGVYTLVVQREGYAGYQSTVTIDSEPISIKIELRPLVVESGILLLVGGKPICLPGSGCPTIFTLQSINSITGCAVLTYYIEGPSGAVLSTFVIDTSCVTIVNY
jgi:large repetitive protein